MQNQPAENQPALQADLKILILQSCQVYKFSLPEYGHITFFAYYQILFSILTHINAINVSLSRIQLSLADLKESSCKF